jgi:molybdenum cofactor cytidylyltransferase
MRTFALIPAAGLSQRMGRPKLLLPLGGRTVLEHVLAALDAGGVAEKLVVVGPDGAALAEVAARAGSGVLRLDEQTPDMRATCLHGLDALEERYRPGPEDGWLLVPADHPTLDAALVRTLVTAAEAEPAMAVVVPAYQGRRGHPVWIRWRHLADIRRLPPDQGLNHFIRSQAGLTRELDWPDAEVLRDLDTPGDYEQLLRDHEGSGQS